MKNCTQRLRRAKEEPEISLIVRPERGGRTSGRVFGDTAESQPHITFIREAGVLMEGVLMEEKKNEGGKQKCEEAGKLGERK